MVDAQAQTELRELLEQRLRGEVRFDPYARSLYSTDASNHQITPLGVVLPETEEDLFAAVDTAADLGVPLQRGAWRPGFKRKRGAAGCIVSRHIHGIQ